MKNSKKCDRIETNNRGSRRWASCPVCGKNVYQLLPNTVAHNWPLYCPRCKRETIIDIQPEPEPEPRA